MYTFSNNLKTFSFILMIIGIIGIGYGFYSVPKNLEEVETMITANHGHIEHSKIEEKK